MSQIVDDIMAEKDRAADATASYGSDDFKIPVNLSGSGPATPPVKKTRKPRDPNAPKKRRALDAYMTVDNLARSIVERVNDYASLPERILEPTAGDGAFIGACRIHYPADVQIGAVDLDPTKHDACLNAGANSFLHRDILLVLPEIIRRFDLIIGNPPFKDAARIVRHLHMSNPETPIFFLLPVSFFGKSDEAERDATFRRDCPIVYFAPIIPRPSFTNDGRTDRMEYGLFGWGKRLLSAVEYKRLGEPIEWAKKPATPTVTEVIP